MRDPMDRPNVILVVCDDLGYGDLGCYGSAVNDTPFLDRMAREGIRFTDFYSAAPVCSPSRGALLTGCYPKRIGFDSFEGRGVLFPGDPVGLHPDEVTIAKVLKARGYSTKLVGKWHCGDQPEFLPTRHGFDSYFGLPYSNDMGRQVGGRRPLPPLPLLLNEEPIELQPDQAGLTERYVEHSLAFIRENKERPFFLYLAHMYVHLPIYVQQPFLQRSRNGAYGAAVACIDWAMGMILFELERLGLAQNTLIIFTSDNGARGDHGGSNAPLRGGKGTTWEGGQRVPCIMYWPGAIPAGAVCREMATMMDILPTVALLAGGAVDPAGGDAAAGRTIDGKDIRPLMFGEPGARTPHDAFFYYAKDRLEAVRSGKWKLHVAKRGEPMTALYDLSQDAGETEDLSSAHPEVVEELQAKLAACRLDLGDALTGVAGRNCRSAGRVEHPVVLGSERAAAYPFIAAEYDLPDRG